MRRFRRHWLTGVLWFWLEVGMSEEIFAVLGVSLFVFYRAASANAPQAPADGAGTGVHGNFLRVNGLRPAEARA